MESTETVETVLTLDPMVVMFVLSTILPAIQQIITTPRLSNWIKQVIAAATSVAAAVISTSVTLGGEAVISKTTLTLAFMSFITQTLVYLGILKKNDFMPIPNFGIGPKGPIDVGSRPTTGAQLSPTESNALSGVTLQDQG